jgi:hypothetical protein
MHRLFMQFHACKLDTGVPYTYDVNRCCWQQYACSKGAVRLTHPGGRQSSQTSQTAQPAHHTSPSPPARWWVSKHTAGAGKRGDNNICKSSTVGKQAQHTRPLAAATSSAALQQRAGPWYYQHVCSHQNVHVGSTHTHTHTPPTQCTV